MSDLSERLLKLMATACNGYQPHRAGPGSWRDGSDGELVCGVCGEDRWRHTAREATEAVAERDRLRLDVERLTPPVFWQHAIQECNEAHQALDRLCAPKTRMVPRLRGEGNQEITIGLRDRILSIPKLDEQAERALAEARTQTGGGARCAVCGGSGTFPPARAKDIP